MWRRKSRNPFCKLHNIRRKTGGVFLGGESIREHFYNSKMRAIDSSPRTTHKQPVFRQKFHLFSFSLQYTDRFPESGSKNHFYGSKMRDSLPRKTHKQPIFRRKFHFFHFRFNNRSLSWFRVREPFLQLWVVKNLVNDKKYANMFVSWSN